MDPVRHPHDALFKETLSNKENAKSFLANYLPKELLPLVDLEHIEIEKDSFVTPELEQYFSDLLYKVRLAGQTGYIYLLFEHKSYHATSISLQLLEYMLQCWKLKREQNQPLPVIVPLVIYHGQEARTTPLHLSPQLACYDERLRAYVPILRTSCKTCRNTKIKRSWAQPSSR